MSILLISFRILTCMLSASYTFPNIILIFMISPYFTDLETEAVIVLGFEASFL